ncbi:MAG TPA: toll/interleukin-1 receptor domain-containing protein [Polyangiaceae bacterium]|nr:toll/interleukin-1 receptor domain-containing protein [Polyangiaceae bacterium]
MFEIFISYAREDAARIEPLALCLERRGWSVFWDRKIQAGQQWHDLISSALDGAQRVIVAWSEHSLRSDFVRDEAASAQERKVLVPILLDKVTPPLGFRQIQTADFSEWNGEEDAPLLQQLLADLGSPSAKAEVTVPTTTVSTAPAFTRSRPAEAPRKFPVVPAAVGAGVVALAAVLLILTRGESPARRPPAPRPAASAVSTPPPLDVPKPATSVAPVVAPPNSSEVTERAQAHATLVAYYRALNAGSFDAEQYFAPRVSLYIGMKNPTLDALNRYFKNDFPRLYEDYSIEMSAEPLRREGPRVFTFREVSHFVDIAKKRRRRDMTAENRVTFDEAGKIVRFEQTYIRG